MTISVTSHDGKLAFGPPVRVTVRSAVFGGWAVGVTVAALVFLAGWWANHFRRTRRSRRVPPRRRLRPQPPGHVILDVVRRVGTRRNPTT